MPASDQGERQVDPGTAVLIENLGPDDQDDPGTAVLLENLGPDHLPTGVSHNFSTEESDDLEGSLEEDDVLEDDVLDQKDVLEYDEFFNEEDKPGGYRVALTTTDEGYQSMNKQEHVNMGIEDDVHSDSDSVRTDNRDSSLPPAVKDRLSSYFAQELLDGLKLSKDQLVDSIDRICSSMPDLLREYSTLAESHARSGPQERACIFVRHQRK